MVLLRAGFTMPQPVASCAVRSYRTLSPLPLLLRALRRSALCCTFRRLTPPRRYLALCSMEPGLSSPMHHTALKRAMQLTPERLSGRLRGGTLTARGNKCKFNDCATPRFSVAFSLTFANKFTYIILLMTKYRQMRLLTGILAALGY